MINHIEKYIGTISHGSKSDSGNRYKLNIAAIPSSSNRNLKTYITLGLSKYNLNYKSRFEILFVCSLKYDENQIFPFLRWLAETIIENKKILLRGQVIYLPRSIVDSTKMDALYVSAPFYFDDDFQVCYGEHYNIVFPLLVPLYKQEAELVEKKGWNAFEQFLLDNEVGNLSDMNRKPFTW
ncbi:TPA: suppressor of fused domain protein [Neisseria subflava]